MFGKSIKFLLLRHIGIMTTLAVSLTIIMSIAVSMSGGHRETWQEYIAAREGRHASLNSVSRALGYGGLVHNLYNLALRGGEKYVLATDRDIVAALSSIDQYQALHPSELERITITFLKDELTRARLSLRDLQARVKAGDDAEEILANAPFDLERIARSLASLERSATFELPSGIGSAYWAQLRDLWRMVGMDGFIHHYKKFLVTGVAEEREHATEMVVRAKTLLAQLDTISSGGAQKEALTLIGLMLDEYLRAMDKIAELQVEGLSVREIDRRVTIDDRPALGAFSTLISSELARIENQGKQNLVSMQEMESIIIWGSVPLLAIFVFIFLSTSIFLRKMLQRSLEEVSQRRDAILADDDDIQHAVSLRKSHPLLDEFETCANYLEDVGNVLREERMMSAQQRRILDRLPNGIIAFSAGGAMAFSNARMPEIIDMPRSWFKGSKSKDELLLYLATRGDFGSGVPADLANFYIEMTDDLSVGETTSFTLDTSDDRHIRVRVEREVSNLILLSADDVTREEKSSRAKEIEARTDWLTGLPNRKAAEEAGPKMLSDAAENRQAMAVLSMDMDGFKPINDQYGHAAGDLVLRETAKRIKAELREGDYAARVGGDEFQLVLNRLDDANGAELFARRLVRVLEDPIDLGDGTMISVSASIGIACYPLHGKSLQGLVHRADEAMYGAKALVDDRVLTASNRAPHAEADETAIAS